jgi:hypothetical protein
MMCWWALIAMPVLIFIIAAWSICAVLVGLAIGGAFGEMEKDRLPPD